MSCAEAEASKATSIIMQTAKTALKFCVAKEEDFVRNRQSLLDDDSYHSFELGSVLASAEMNWSTSGSEETCGAWPRMQHSFIVVDLLLRVESVLTRVKDVSPDFHLTSWDVQES